MAAPKTPRLTQKDLAEAEDVDFTDEHEYWNSYKLKDGTTLKVKLVLRGVKRLKRWGADGSPMYLISSANIVRAVDVPKHLKAKPKVSEFRPI